MAIYKCRKCKSEVEKSAQKCPECGVKYPLVPTWLMIAVLSLILIVALGIFAPASEPQKEVKICDKQDRDCLVNKYKADVADICKVILDANSNFKGKFEFDSPLLSSAYFDNTKQDYSVMIFEGVDLLVPDDIGVHTRYNYQCFFDVNTEKVIDVKVKVFNKN